MWLFVPRTVLKIIVYFLYLTVLAILLTKNNIHFCMHKKYHFNNVKLNWYSYRFVFHFTFIFSDIIDFLLYPLII